MGTAGSDPRSAAPCISTVVGFRFVPAPVEHRRPPPARRSTRSDLTQMARHPPDDAQGGEPLDLVVIGAGPHALALMAKLMEPHHHDKWEERSSNANMFSRDAQVRCQPIGVRNAIAGRHTRRPIVQL